MDNVIYRYVLIKLGDEESRIDFPEADNNDIPMHYMSTVMNNLGENKIPWRATQDRIYWVHDGTECEVKLMGG